MPLSLERAASLELLAEGWRRIRVKNARGGLDGQSVDSFSRGADRELVRLREELLAGRYVPEPVVAVSVPKPGKPGQYRPIGLAAVRDKVVQHAVRILLEPAAERRFLGCSYAYRPKRGATRAIRRVCHALIAHKHRWVARADVDNCFSSLHHDLLLAEVRSLGVDEGLLRLIELWIGMGAVDRMGDWHDVASGISQGSVLSPMLANLYLHPFDCDMAERGHSLVRYADDFILTAASRDQVSAAAADAVAFLTVRLRLHLNSPGAQVYAATDGFAFLGIGFTPSGLTLPPSTIEKADAWADMIKSRARSDWRAAVRDYSDTVSGWTRYYGPLVVSTELAPLAEAARTAARALRDAATTPDDRNAICNLPVPPGCTTEGWHTSLTPSSSASTLPPGLLGVSPPLSPPVALPSPAAVVRSRRRRHHKEQSHAAELLVDVPGSFIGKSGQALVVRRQRELVFQSPALRLTGVTIVGRGVSLSADAIALCAERSIPLTFVSPDGRLLAALAAPNDRAASNCARQFLAIQTGRAVFLASRLVESKIRNQGSLIKYLGKHRRLKDPAFRERADDLLESMPSYLGEVAKIRRMSNLDTARGLLLGIEGRFAQRYWTAFAAALPPSAAFPGRQRQGSRDLVNSLLNYGYGVLQRRANLAIAKAGLNPSVSFLHALRRSEPTLVFDLIEPFRPHVVDRTVIALLARREPASLDNTQRLTVETRRRLLKRLLERLGSITPYRGAQRTFAAVIDGEARALADALEPGTPYRVFVARW